MSEMWFEGKRKGEHVRFIFRRHLLTIRKGFIFMMIMIVVGFVPMVIWPSLDWLFWVWIGAIVVGVLGLLYVWMLWYFSFYIVTTERIRQISQKGLFKKTVVDLGLDKIQSIAYDMPGLGGHMFGYGTLLIQTQVGDMVISSVAHPAKVYNKLQNVMGELGNVT